MTRTLKQMNHHIDIMSQQVQDIMLLEKYKDVLKTEKQNSEIYNMYVRTYLNFKQRRRFIAITYAKNSTEALERLFEVEHD